MHSEINKQIDDHIYSELTLLILRSSVISLKPIVYRPVFVGSLVYRLLYRSGSKISSEKSGS